MKLLDRPLGEKPLARAVPVQAASESERARLEQGIEGYAGMRPNRPAVVEALRKLAQVAPRDCERLLRIWLMKIEEGEWPVAEPFRRGDFVDPDGVRYVTASNLVMHKGAVREGWRNCLECNGLGWHHREDAKGHTWAIRCGDCARAYAAWLSEQRSKEGAASKRGSRREDW